MIIIDSREDDDVIEKMQNEMEELGYESDVEYLPSGDFLVKDNIIERKVFGDFIGRLTNSERDIWQQMLKMEAAANDLDYRPTLVLEGEWQEAMRWTNLTAKEVTMAIASIYSMGFSVMHTMGPRATAQWVAKLDDGGGHDIGSIRDTPSVPEDMYSRYMTEGFVGVGPSRAEDILEKYGTFGDVVLQILDDPDELQEIDGIGEATVEKMERMVTQE